MDSQGDSDDREHIRLRLGLCGWPEFADGCVCILCVYFAGICCSFGIGDNTTSYSIARGQSKTFTVNDYIDSTGTQIVGVKPNFYNFDDASKAASQGIYRSTSSTYASCKSAVP